MCKEKLDISPFIGPGIYQVECIETKKSFFGETESIFYTLLDIRINMAQGICENQEVLQDLNKYGIDGFRFWLVITDLSLFNPEARKRMLEEVKKDWEGDLYF